MYLSILVPVFNEERTVVEALARLLAVEFEVTVEIIVVNDGSTDGTAAALLAVSDKRVRIFSHPVNRGKGAAIRTAASHAEGEYVVMYDADLEYSPDDLPRLLEPTTRGQARVVFGTRTFGSHSAYSFWYVMGNKGVTLAANVLYNAYISDLETCFKLMPLELYRSLDITQEGFGMEAEVAAKILKRGIRPYEVPISYVARSREEGKKITWRDGMEAVWILGRHRIRTGN